MAARNESPQSRGHTDTDKQHDLFIRTLNIYADSIKDITGDAEKASRIKDVAASVSEGRGVVYTIHGTDAAGMVKAKLDAEEIPFAPIRGNKNLIILDKKHQKKAFQINKKCLKEKSRYSQTAEPDQFEDLIAKNDTITDKELITVTGLTHYECESFKDKCSDISKGFITAERENDDGTYNLTFRAGKLYEADSRKKDICRATTEYAISLYGPLAADSVRQTEDRDKMAAAENEVERNGREYWISCEEDPCKYMHLYPTYNKSGEISGQGFDYVERFPVIGSDGTLVMKEDVKSHDSSEPGYEEALSKAENSIRKKIFSRSEEDLSDALDGIEWTDPDRIASLYRKSQISIGQKALVEKADAMIKEKLSDISPDEAFYAYREGFARIMSGLKENRVPEGYDREDMAQLLDISDRYGVDMSGYDLSVTRFNSIELIEHEAREMTRDIIRDDRNREKEETITRTRETTIRETEGQVR